MTDGLRPWLEDCRTWADRALEEAFVHAAGAPAAFLEALRYPVFGGGKRFRPALVRTVAQHLGAPDGVARPAAAALELVHTYSLVHDDLPCMDDDDLRRGRPTVHRAFDEATAVLVGDGLQTLAFEVLADAPTPLAAQMTAILARASGAVGMVGGQVLDLSGSGAVVDRDAVGRIHELKTAALVRAATELGAAAAGLDAARRGPWARYGEALGLLFQAVDDLLDVTGDASELGKTPGKDAAGDKPTLVAALGFEGAEREAARLAELARGAALQAGAGEGSRPLALVDYLLTRRS